MSTKNSTENSSQITILRIKRKRTDEPLDALLVHQENEKKLKKNNDNERKSVLEVSMTALPTLFRLAETVEQKSFSNLDEAKKLKDRISRRIQPGSSRPQTPTSLDEKRDRLVKDQQEAASKARYRVINQNRSMNSENAPPIVQSSSELEAKKLFQVFEAVKDEEETPKKANLFVDDDIEDPDDIMCNFIPMVKEYLTLNDREEKEEKEEDYVYDVYYRDDKNIDEGMKSMNVGSLVWFENESEYLDDDSDSELGDMDDEDSNAEDYYQNDYPEEENSDEFEDQYNYDLSSDEDYY